MYILKAARLSFSNFRPLERTYLRWARKKEEKKSKREYRKIESKVYEKIAPTQGIIIAVQRHRVMLKLRFIDEPASSLEKLSLSYWSEHAYLRNESLSLPLYADVLLGHREVFMRFFRVPCREATKAAMVCVYPFLTKDWNVVKFL